MVWNMLGFEEKEAAPAPQTKHKRLEDEAMSRTVEEALECDYETNCTPLYKKIESAMQDSEWEPVVKFLDTGYWPGSLFMDSLSPQEQVRTWVTRFDATDPTKVKWSQLPLHVAVVCKAPFKVVARLVEMYPQAVRCTDDQHMLPLHLALRHAASDEIVAYLLTQFPDAVNAKGKDDRTPVECALRADNKLRGKILQIFIEKAKHRSAAKENALKAQLASKAAQLEASEAHLQEALEAKDEELQEVVAELEALEKTRGSTIDKMQLQLDKAHIALVELEKSKKCCDEEISRLRKYAANGNEELVKKVEELERENREMKNWYSEKIRKLEDDKLVQELDYERKIKDLEESRVEVEIEHRRMKEEEASMRRELEGLQRRVVDVSDMEDLEALKDDVQNIKQYRLELSRTMVEEQFENLRNTLEKSMRESDDKTKEEMKHMQEALNELRSTGTKAQTNEEVDALRTEVELLREELKDRAALSKTKLELAEMRRAMEAELRNSEGKTNEELIAIKAAVEAMNVAELENKTKDELSTLKAELENLKKEMRENELVNKTREEVEELRAVLERELAVNNSSRELVSMKSMVENMSTGLGKMDATNEEILTIRKELELVKEELKQQEEANKTRKDVEELRELLEREVSQARGETKDELKTMKMAVDSLFTDLSASTTNSEVVKLRKELDAVKIEMKQMEDAAKARKEVEELKTTLEREIQEARGATKVELNQMKEHLEQMYVNLNSNNKNGTDMEEMKQQLSALKEEMKQMDEVAQTKKDVEELRAALENELKAARGATKVELNVMKKAVDSLSSDLNKSTNNKEILQLKKELDTLKEEMKVIDEAAKTKKDVEELKAMLEKELKQARGVSKEELAAMKQTVDSMSNDLAKTQSNQEILMLKEAVDALKEEMKNKEETAKAKKDVEALREALEADLRESRGQTKNELAALKKTVDSMHKNLSSSKTSDEIVALRKELITVKEELQAKEEISQLKLEMLTLKKSMEAELRNSEGKTKEELAELKKAVKAADERQLESKSFDELNKIKNQMEDLRSQMVMREEANMTKQELANMKAILEQQMKEWEGKTKEDILVMKATVDALSASQLEGKSNEEWEIIKKELDFLKQDVQNAEAASKTKQELTALRNTLEKELKVSEGKTEEELLAMKQALDAIDISRVEIKNKEQWDAIRNELEGLKDELREKDIGTATLQRELEQLRVSQLVAQEEMLKPKQKKGLKRFFSRFRRMRGSKKNTEDSTVAETVLETSKSDEKKSSSKKKKATPKKPTVPAPAPVVPEPEEDDDVMTYLPPSIARSGSLDGGALRIVDMRKQKTETSEEKTTIDGPVKANTIATKEGSEQIKSSGSKDSSTGLRNSASKESAGGIRSISSRDTSVTGPIKTNSSRASADSKTQSSDSKKNPIAMKRTNSRTKKETKEQQESSPPPAPAPALTKETPNKETIFNTKETISGTVKETISGPVPVKETICGPMPVKETIASPIEIVRTISKTKDGTQIETTSVASGNGPYNVVRTVSKTMTSTGDVEIEPLAEDDIPDDEEPLQIISNPEGAVNSAVSF